MVNSPKNVSSCWNIIGRRRMTSRRPGLVMASADALFAIGTQRRDSQKPSATCSSKSFTCIAWVMELRDRPFLNASITERLYTSITSCALLSPPGCLRRHSMSISSNANSSLSLMGWGSHSCGNPPPAENLPHGIDTTPSHWFDDASDAARVTRDAKWRALYHGPSWDVDDRLSHALSSARRSGVLSRCIARPSAFAIAANMKWVRADAGRMGTDMLAHLPAIFSITRTGIVPFSNSDEIRVWSLRSLSSGIRKQVVLESRRMPRYRCILEGFRSHLVSDRK